MIPQHIRQIFEATRLPVTCWRIPVMREQKLRNFSGRDSFVFATTTRITDGLD